MKLSREIRTKITYIVFVLFVLVTVGIFFSFARESQADYSFDDNSIYDWSDDWTVTYGNHSPEKMSFPAVVPVARGGVVIIKKTLPDRIKKYNCIVFESKRQDVLVHVGGVLRSSYSDKDTRIAGQSSPFSLVMVPIYSTDEGADISFIISSDTRFSGNIGNIYLGNEGSITLSLVKESIIWLSLTVILALMGLVSLISYINMGKNFEEGGSLIYLFFLAVLTSIWIFSQLKARQVFVKDIALMDAFGYCCYMLSLLPLICLANVATRKRYELFFDLYKIMVMINFLTQTVVQLLEKGDFFNMMIITKSMLIGLIVIALILCIMELKRKPTRTIRFLIVCLTVLCVCILIEEISNVNDYSFAHSFALGVVFLVITFYTYIVISAGREQQRKKNAEAANIAKSQFLATMSHEIRTPINAVLGMNEMIMRDSSEEVIRGYAADVASAGKSLLSLVNDILDFSKIESGKMDIIYVQYSMKSLLRDLILMIQGRIKTKNLELVLDIDPTIPSVYMGDEVRVKQILTNLLTNAAKYTESGKIIFTVQNRGIEGDSILLYFSIKDTGIGIREEDIQKLMESSFVRVDQKKNRNIEGTGLGLSITRQLLVLMDSKLEISSEYGKGSDFHFEIRQKIVDTAPLGTIEVAGKESVKAPTKKNTFRAPWARLLAVDDTRTNLVVVKGLLKPYEIQVVTCDSGERCLELCREQYFDVILMDHMMPGMDGIETLKALRADSLSKCSRARVIALTANAIAGAAEMYKENGFDGYMAKPIEVSELDQKLKEILPIEYIIT